MKGRPILFNASMVHALLEGRKTLTRRIVKMKPSDWCKEIKGDCWHQNDIAEWRLQGDRWFGLMGWYTLAFADCPYGQPGDRLWVRETQLPKASGTIYRADFSEFEAAGLGGMYGGWKPSIFCKREHSRILLEITGVRVERLQDISCADAKAEGIERSRDGMMWRDYISASHAQINPIDSYRTLWESINGPGSWDANPWVWVIEFKSVKP
ncbi:MAG: hypothetical protein ACYC1F_05720 [Gallionellaceae bacterium]